VNILGVRWVLGKAWRAVDLGPSAIRVAGLAGESRGSVYDVVDLDDLEIERPRRIPRRRELKYLSEIHDACERLAAEVEKIVDAGVLPITIGGDHFNRNWFDLRSCESFSPAQRNARFDLL